MRRVHQVYHAPQTHWVGNGFKVSPLFSHMAADKVTDPFLMFDYAMPMEFAPNEAKPRGVGAHPHRGFETVTIAYQGEVAHRDSSGGGGVIQEGDVQWMTAGAGIIHDEFHSEEFSKKGGMFEMAQLWVNLPAAAKNTPASYQHLAAKNIPNIAIDGGRLRLIAGEYNGQHGTANTHTEMNVWDVFIEPNRTIQLEVPATHNLLLTVRRGNITVNGNHRAEATQLISFEQEGGAIELTADTEGADILLLSGVPIGEPIAAYGPFVMNTDAEIEQAFRDFKDGKYGEMPA
ncbi:pirin family protein [Suttonella ornithocola]|uniref:Quercetin 2,3-dioxygenase n=1 Tax=Suttonella ornithocola TaxID=279832 RepID=A0A380MRS8_9GAMM|nr:pirin family protein [Suttonella ornithocola]SUO94037.1 Quercetin 2,3-dioxygenase [Suttonella ornithocola]